MPQIVITPRGLGAIESGLMIDETGERFVVLTFKDPEADPVLVTFTLPVFQGFVDSLTKSADAAADEFSWQVPE